MPQESLSLSPNSDLASEAKVGRALGSSSPALRAADAGSFPYPSPAHVLEALLDGALPDFGQSLVWPLRTTAAFVAFICGAFWMSAALLLCCFA